MIRWAMITLLICNVLRATPLEFEQKFDSGTLKGYRFGACDYWQRFNSDFGSAYACGFSPQRIVVADGNDVANLLEKAEARILQLEERVADLEKKINP